MPESSTAYRNPSVDDAEDDDDDLDDLDDVLESFNAPARPASAKRPLPASPPRASSSALASAAAPAPTTGSPGPAADEEDDYDELARGMEDLLRSLAVSHPPGPMPDAPGPRAPVSTGLVDSVPSLGGAGAGEQGDPLSPEEEDKAWKRAMELLLSPEGVAALGLDEGIPPPATGSDASDGQPGPAPSFEETMRRAMEGLNAGGAGARGGAGDGVGAGQAGLAELLKQLEEGEEGDELGGLLDGMMAQLMSKDVLEEPMAELADKYPAYLACPPANVTPVQLETYRAQHALVEQIVAAFRRPGYSDDVDGKEVARLVGQMQDLGGPPAEIMGELPEGFDMGALGGLGGDGECSIM
ncbi:Peroxisome chaperone and import receptor [Cryptotrichosporon argae]